MNSELWLSTRNLAPESIRGKKIKVKNKMCQEFHADLEIESEKDGKMVISANYNSSPFQGTVVLAKFNLTQEQFDAFLDKGPKCVLEVPH